MGQAAVAPGRQAAAALSWTRCMQRPLEEEAGQVKVVGELAKTKEVGLG